MGPLQHLPRFPLVHKREQTGREGRSDELKERRSDGVKSSHHRNLETIQGCFYAGDVNVVSDV